MKSAIALVVLLLATIFMVSVAFGDEYTYDELADAIYWAENSERYPYGIVSVKCDGKDDCRQICINTIRNNMKRYKEYGYKQYDTYLEFLASRYCPIGAENDPNNLNQNWLNNVKFFLRNHKPVDH